MYLPMMIQPGEIQACLAPPINVMFEIAHDPSIIIIVITQVM